MRRRMRAPPGTEDWRKALDHSILPRTMADEPEHHALALRRALDDRGLVKDEIDGDAVRVWDDLGVPFWRPAAP